MRTKTVKRALGLGGNLCGAFMQSEDIHLLGLLLAKRECSAL